VVVYLCFVWCFSLGVCESEVWGRVYTVYSKDYSLLEEFVVLALRDPEGFLECARKYTLALNVVPEVVVLGFSPQPLVAVLSLRGRVDYVVTSPEVVLGNVSAARFSHRILGIYKPRIGEVIEAPMAPTQSIPPLVVLEKLGKAFSKVKNRVVDISGGTQLAAIAAVKSGIEKLTYTYPNGEKLVIYPITTVEKQ